MEPEQNEEVDHIPSQRGVGATGKPGGVPLGAAKARPSHRNIHGKLNYGSFLRTFVIN